MKIDKTSDNIIMLDLLDSIKTKINNIQTTINIRNTEFPNSLHSCNINNNYVEMFSFDVGSNYMKVNYIDNTSSPYIIGYDLSDTTKNTLSTIPNLSNNVVNLQSTVNNITTSIFNTQNFKYTLSSNATKYYKLGTLTLPQGGNQAIIQINLCCGYNLNSTSLPNLFNYYLQNYQVNINLYSSNGAVNINGKYFGSSRSVDPGSGGTNQNYYKTGIFHNGFVNIISPFVNPCKVYLGLTSDPLNNIDIYIKSSAYHGVPLINVSQSNGSFTKDFAQLDALPLTGYIQLDSYQNTLTKLYKNPYNV
jgi:hypothetical protein